jgi:outer membrane protein
MGTTNFRELVAVLLTWASITSPLLAQTAQENVQKPRGNVLIRPYQGVFVPQPSFSNSSRLAQLVRGGKLYLTAQDAVALALENDIDLQVDRYNPLLSLWAVQRAEAGGAARGVNTQSAANFTSAAGQGLQGSASTVGTGNLTGGNAGATTPSGSATVTQIGPVTQVLDTVFNGAAFFGHLTTPEASRFAVLSGTTTLIQGKRIYNASLQQGLLTGGTATLSYSSSYLNENAFTDVLNPSTSPTLSISVNHNFLQGFGIPVNSRTIVVAKNNIKVADYTFRSQVIDVVSNVLTLYWTLVQYNEDIAAKQTAVDLAQRLYNDNQKQVQIGTLAPIEITRAESQLATTKNDLTQSETRLLQEEIQLKNVLSRTGTADPLIAEVRIVPLDHVEVPTTDNTPPLKDLLQLAKANRMDLAAEEIDLQNAKISALGTASGLLPTLRGTVVASSQGLTGTPNPRAPAAFGTADPAFVGGYGNAVGQIFRRNYPSQRAQALFIANLRNNVAQADYGIEQLQLRQTELSTARDFNSLLVNVANNLTALQQARIRYEATVKSRQLQEQLLTAEQKKYSLGSSTTYNVVQVQRDLAAAKSNEEAAKAQYANSKIGLDRVLGTTLDTYHISLENARSGHVFRESTLPPAQQ